VLDLVQDQHLPLAYRQRGDQSGKDLLPGILMLRRRPMNGQLTRPRLFGSKRLLVGSFVLDPAVAGGMDDRQEPNENLLVGDLAQLLKRAQTSAEHDVLCA
jgi:hypothetical protein